MRSPSTLKADGSWTTTGPAVSNGTASGSWSYTGAGVLSASFTHGDSGNGGDSLFTLAVPEPDSQGCSSQYNVLSTLAAALPRAWRGRILSLCFQRRLFPNRRPRMKWTLLPAALAAALLVAADSKEDAAKKDADAIQGKWAVVSLTRNGKTEAISKDAVRVITADTYAMKLRPLLTIDGTYKIDPTTNPKAIETTPSSGPYKDKAMLGIYELNGDSLKICYALPGEDRPTEFSGKAGSGWILTVHKKLKE
jgi:uncharacterized protein (TIGR03067 family)